MNCHERHNEENQNNNDEQDEEQINDEDEEEEEEEEDDHPYMDDDETQDNSNNDNNEEEEEDQEDWDDLDEFPEALREEFLFESQCEKLATNEEGFTFYDASAALDDDKAFRLGLCMMGNTHLLFLSVTIGANLTSQGVHALAGGIHGCTKLRMLALCADHELSDVVDLNLLYMPSIVYVAFDFPMGDRFATRLGAFLLSSSSASVQGQGLKSLVVSINRMTPHGAQELCHGIQKCHSLTHLEFGFKDPHPPSSYLQVMDIIYREGVYQLSSSFEVLTVCGHVGNMSTLTTVLSNLTHLWLEDIALSVTDVELLVRGLTRQATPRLDTLSLTACDLRDEYMAILAPGLLSASSPITKLELNGNRIGDAGIVSLVKHWNRDSFLRELKLDNNKVGRLGGEILVEAVSCLKKLRVVSLNGNTGIGYDGLQRIGAALSGKTLLLLHLDGVVQWHDYDDEDEKCDGAVLQDSKRDLASKALLEGVQNNIFLQYLHVSGLFLLPQVEAELNIYTEANRCGRYLLLLQDTLPPVIWCHFLATRRNDASLLFLFLRELPTLMMTYNAPTPMTSHNGTVPTIETLG